MTRPEGGCVRESAEIGYAAAGVNRPAAQAWLVLTIAVTMSSSRSSRGP